MCAWAFSVVVYFHEKSLNVHAVFAASPAMSTVSDNFILPNRYPPRPCPLAPAKHNDEKVPCHNSSLELFARHLLVEHHKSRCRTFGARLQMTDSDDDDDVDVHLSIYRWILGHPRTRLIVMVAEKLRLSQA